MYFISASYRCIFRKMCHCELIEICKRYWGPQGSKSWTSSKIGPGLVWSEKATGTAGPVRPRFGMSGKNHLCRTVFTLIQYIPNVFFSRDIFYIFYFYVFTNKQACLIHSVLMTFKPVASDGLSSVPRSSSGITERNVKDLKCIPVYLLWEVQTIYFAAWKQMLPFY